MSEVRLTTRTQATPTCVARPWNWPIACTALGLERGATGALVADTPRIFTGVFFFACSGTPDLVPVPLPAAGGTHNTTNNWAGVNAFVSHLASDASGLVQARVAFCAGNAFSGFLAPKLRKAWNLEISRHAGPDFTSLPMGPLAAPGRRQPEETGLSY